MLPKLNSVRGRNMRRFCSPPTKCFMLTDSAITNSQLGALLSRRRMLQQMCSGFGMLGLAGLVGPQALAAAQTRGAHFAPRAKRVIFLFLNGGPSHMDTFDPKPALKKYEGQQPEG